MQKRLLLFRPLVFSCDPLGGKGVGRMGRTVGDTLNRRVPTNKGDGEPPAGRDRQPLLRWMS